MKKFIFNSSMPRAGSTLLSNILGNNPYIYATPTSGFFDLVDASKRAYTMSPLFKSQGDMKKTFLTYCRYAMEGYFDSLTDRPCVIDKSRGWVTNKGFLEAFYPEAKVICMVRDLRDIVASMEKNFRKRPDQWDSPLFNNSVGNRVTKWMNPLPPMGIPVGTMVHQIKEAVLRGYANDILFVRFEDLVSSPEKTMRGVYDYLDMDYHVMNYADVKQVTEEDDRFHGKYGDHTIQKSIVPQVSVANKILGNSICEQLKHNFKWYFDKFEYE